MRWTLRDAPTQTRRVQQAVLVTLGLAAIAVGLRVAVAGPVAVAARLDTCELLLCDFRFAYLGQARTIGLDPPQVQAPWIYPPFALVWFVPFAGLSDTHAVALWGAVLAGFALAAWAQAAWTLRGWGTQPAALGALGLVGLSLPVVHGLKWGQLSLPIVVLAVAALSARGDVGRRLGGVVVGLLAATKLYPLAFAALWAARRRPWPVVVAVATAAVASVVVPVIAFGGPASAAMATQLRRAARTLDPAYLGGQWIGAAVHRAVVRGAHVGLDAEQARVGGTLGVAWADGVGLALAAVAVVALLGWTAWRLRGRWWTADGPAVALVLGGLLVPPGWHHYASGVPLALAIVLSRAPVGSAAGLLALAAWALGAAPVALLADVDGVYALASKHSVTTASTLLAWAAVVVGARGPDAPPASGPSGITP